jgi:predicted molibdopterin-dependent oxidoreductase YjgC
LLSYRLLYDAGSRASVTKGIAAHTPAAFAELHPDDAAGLGVEDGATVRVSTAHGTLTVPARVTTHIRPGVVFVPYLQPDASARELLSVDDPAPAAKVERA